VAGLRYVKGEETILALILIALVPSVFVMPFTNGLMPVFAEEVLSSGPNGLGLLLSSFGVGAMAGTFALASMGNMRKKGVLLFVAPILTGLGMMLLSKTTWLPLSALTMALVGVFHVMYRVTNNTLLQTLTPDEYRGRVMSIYLLDHGLVPLGSFLAGTIAELVGSAGAILTGGLIDAALILLVVFRFKSLLRITV
jgi:predicted MFS family arabinose efflux permease